MKKIYALIIALLTLYGSASAQGRVLLGQYFQNLPAFSPSFTGINDYIDIRGGFRKQWAGFDNSPSTGYISAYSPLKIKKNHYAHKSLRSSSNDQYLLTGGRPPLRMGIGGYVLSDQRGPIRETEAILNFAVHVPVQKNTYLSLGMSGGLIDSRIDQDELTVVDPVNDVTFQAYLDNAQVSNLTLNASLGLHSDNYYISYSLMQLAQAPLGGNDAISDNSGNIRHHILGGYRLFLDAAWELIPNTFLRIEDGQPFFFEAGARVRYNGNVWFGASYRNDQSYVGMLGLSLSDLLTLGYSFEYKQSDFTQFNNGSHEIVLGLRLKNHGKYTSIW